MTSDTKKAIKFLISGNITFIIGSLLPIILFGIAAILMVTYDPGTDSDRMYALEPPDDLLRNFFVFVCAVVGSIVFLLFFVISKILAMIGSYTLRKKSKSKTIRQSGTISLVILSLAFASVVLFPSIVIIVIRGSAQLEIIYFALIAFAGAEYLAMALFSLSNVVVTLRMGKVKELSIINICSCIILTPGPIIIYFLLDYSTTSATVFLVSIPFIIGIGMFWAILNIISLRFTLRELPTKEK